MTNDEAIKLLVNIAAYDIDSKRGEKKFEALWMAIKALEQKPKAGCWFKTPKAVMGEGYMWYCSDCQYQVYQDKSKDYPSEKFCPNCGAKMFKPREIAKMI